MLLLLESRIILSEFFELNKSYYLYNYRIISSFSNQYWNSATKYVLKLHLSISSFESCTKCRTQTLQSITSELMPFNIPLQYDSSIIITIQNPVVNIIDLSEEKTLATKGGLIVILNIYIE